MIDRKAEILPPSAIRRPLVCTIRCIPQKKVLVIFLLIFLTISSPLQVFAESKEQKKENPVSNEEFVRESVKALLDKTFLDFPRKESRLIFVNAEEENPANWLLEDELVSYLQSLNFHVALNQKNRLNEFTEAWSLFYRIIDMRFFYPQVKRKGFLGGKLMTRKAGLNLSFRLEEKESGKILWTKKETEERTDVVEKNMIKYLNNDSYSFLSPPLPEDRQTKYIEPALVAAVVGGLIYLFFANR